MNIDLIPLSALALDSSRDASRFVAEPQTLTLLLTPPLQCGQEPPMSGRASVGTPQPAQGLLCAAVLGAPGAPLTITF
jgi:hypothetical protein